MKQNRYYSWITLVAVFLLTLITLVQKQSLLQAKELPPASASEGALLEQLNQLAGGTVRISYHAETGKVRYIGTSPEMAIPQAALTEQVLTPEVAARGFLAQYGSLFGLTTPDKELDVIRDRTLEDGRSFVRFQQTYQDIPVVGGELIVQVGADQKIISANGEVLPDLSLDVNPDITAENAQQNALKKIAKDYGLDVTQLDADSPELWIYNPILLGSPGQRKNTLVWRLEVTSKELLPIRELVLVDAQLGVVTLSFNQIHAAKDREVYDNNNNPALGLPGNGPVRSEGDAATGVTDVDLAYDYAGDTYDFFFNEHGRDSLDGSGMTIISTVRYCTPTDTCPYANAFWNGTQMAYGDGYAAADDVVGHELTHGVTDFTSHLFYYYQSGAINESLSDMWGEFIDQTNGAGTDSLGVKWLMGEDIPGGAIRSMANPPAFSDPDKITSSNYWCDETDNGGVHINSGVNNKAAYLMTDGGSFNGFTIAGLGISNVADLYYEVQTNMLTSGSNYNDLYDALIQASVDLGYNTTEQQAVKDTLDAVEMSQRPCSSTAIAPVCTGGQTPVNVFFDDMENTSSGNWSSAAISGSNEWYYPQTANPYSFDATNTSSGVYNLWGYDQPSTADFYIAMTSDVSLPANAYMHFKHYWAFEDFNTTTYDGGVVEYSSNGGSSWNDAGPLFLENGYNGAISTADTNPLGGRQAFTAESYGYTASRLDLSSLAGQDVRFRYRIGTDSTADALGWFIDDVRIYTCDIGGNTAPSISGLPDQTIDVNGSKNNAIDLWTYANDVEDADSTLTFTISNSPDSNAGVTIDSNRYIDINPATDWTGSTNVTIQVEDSGNLTDTDTFQVTVTSDYYVYLPIVLKPAPPAPLGPTPGFWESSTGDEFYVTPDRAFVDDFAIYISVTGCGDYKITHILQEPITNDQFSFTGTFYASGSFNSATAANGTDGLTNFNITGCGSVSGGPWTWNATWQDSSQPVFLPAELIGPETAVPTLQSGKTVIVTPLD
jgi:Zn-dependent metalloprotease